MIALKELMNGQWFEKDCPNITYCRTSPTSALDSPQPQLPYLTVPTLPLLRMVAVLCLFTLTPP